MELIEREVFLNELETRLDKVKNGEGHCVFILGEAGLGKTSLVNSFCRNHEQECDIYSGSCDALFTSRPLAPVYDVALEMKLIAGTQDLLAGRNELFTNVFQKLSEHEKTVVLVFEDIHWADESTLDFIKFLGRRITRLRCLFILTYRDTEISDRHPLREVFAQLPADSISRLQLLPLTRDAVIKLADGKGFDGKDVFRISGGNPFYVNEILASYSSGIPENIKDSILSVYNRLDGTTKSLWQLLSVQPTGFELKYFEKVASQWLEAVEYCFALKIIVAQDGLVFFKHELYRMTIEYSLSPFLRMSLHKQVLDLFRDKFEENHQIERIVHHAKNANDYDLVVQYAPIAAKNAAKLGSHLEAAKLYLSAIEFYQGTDKEKLLEFYQAYAYECYLTKQIREAIIYQGKCLAIWTKTGNVELIGDCMRFLSRLWWFEGNREKAEQFGEQAVEALIDQPASKAKAMSYSNMSQLKLFSDELEECLDWGEKAIAMAKELQDTETVCHAMINVGSARMRMYPVVEDGMEMIKQSLAISVEHSFEEQVARAYTNLGSCCAVLRQFKQSDEFLSAGIQYCEERDMDAWTSYMLAWKSRLYLQTGRWAEALHIAESLIRNDSQPPVVKIGALVVAATIMFRTDSGDPAPLLQEAKIKAISAREMQRTLPVITALLEFEWISGKKYLQIEEVEEAKNLLKPDRFEQSEFEDFLFWLYKSRPKQIPAGYDEFIQKFKDSSYWAKYQCHYPEAIVLLDGSDDHKKDALSILQKLGATAVAEKATRYMRLSGVKGIPRGLRKSTSSNPASLTNRELDILQLLKEGMQNKELASKLYISAKTVDHHVSSILFKLDVSSRGKAVQEALKRGIIK